MNEIASPALLTPPLRKYRLLCGLSTAPYTSEPELTTDKSDFLQSTDKDSEAHRCKMTHRGPSVSYWQDQGLSWHPPCFSCLSPRLQPSFESHSPKGEWLRATVHLIFWQKCTAAATLMTKSHLGFWRQEPPFNVLINNVCLCPLST